MALMLEFYHHGKFGDLIWSLPVIRSRGEGVIHLVDKYPFFPINQIVLDKIKSLLMMQLYIKDVDIIATPRGEFLDTEWVGKMRLPGKTIPQFACERAGVSIAEVETQWLHVARKRLVAKYIFCRTGSAYYHNPNMDWECIVREFGKEAVFVGLGFEYHQFCSKFGKVKYYPTKTFLDAAEVIDGAEHIFTNQGAIHAIAEAMKKNIVLECCVKQPSVMVDRPGVTNVLGEKVGFKETN